MRGVRFFSNTWHSMLMNYIIRFTEALAHKGGLLWQSSGVNLSRRPEKL